jgi:gas vesicle protein
MSYEISNEVSETVNEAQEAIEDRLAQIREAIAARSQEVEEATEVKKTGPLVCPMDPAERALCDSCQ